MRQTIGVSLISMICLSIGSIPAQDRKDPPVLLDPLKELQAESLKNNPDIKVAEAKVMLAQAKLEREREKVKDKVALLYAEAQAARAAFAYAEVRYKRLEGHKGTIAQKELDSARDTLTKLKNELSVKELELQLLAGRREKKQNVQIRPGTPEKYP